MSDTEVCNNTEYKLLRRMAESTSESTDCPAWVSERDFGEVCWGSWCSDFRPVCVFCSEVQVNENPLMSREAHTGDCPRGDWVRYLFENKKAEGSVDGR